jgi:hypothetical protein
MTKVEGSAHLGTGYRGWGELSLVVDIGRAMVGFARLFRPRYACANLGAPVVFVWFCLGQCEGYVDTAGGLSA